MKESVVIKINRNDKDPNYCHCRIIHGRPAFLDRCLFNPKEDSGEQCSFGSTVWTGQYNVPCIHSCQLFGEKLYADDKGILRCQECRNAGYEYDCSTEQHTHWEFCEDKN